MRKLLNTIVIMLLLSAGFIYPIAGDYEELNIKTPGVDIWEGGDYLIDALFTNDVLETDTTDLFHNQTLNIKVNSSLAWTEPYYSIWYPVYIGSIGNTYTLTWQKYKPSSGPSPTIGGTDFTFEDIHLNRSGLWIIDNDNDHSASTLALMNSTIPAWFWVNASEELNINTDNTVFYNEDIPITVNVTKNGKGHACLIDIRDTTTIFPQGDIWADDPNGKITFLSNNLTHAGEYTVYAYHDLDDTQIYYQENPKYYDNTYGHNTITATNYNYTLCGPWDPPEYIAETETITVETSKPIITLSDTSIFWGFHSIIDVNVTDADGQGLTNGELRVKNRHNTYLHTIPPALIITNTGHGNYTVEFARGIANWLLLDTGNVNGTWYICYSEDTNLDGLEEWNNSKSFIVSPNHPDVSIEITDDGHANPTDLKIDVPVYTNPISTIQIDFVIYGGAIAGTGAYYGDDPSEDSDNITITGDILFIPTEDSHTLINHGNGHWSAIIIPSNSGTVTISIDWEDSQDSETIDIGDGTYVTTNITSFVVDENATIWVTVKNINNNNEEYSDVHLIWEDDGTVINHTKGDGELENGQSGKYKFIIDTTQHRNTAPQKIIICADTPALDYWGYSTITMIPNSDLKVECTPTTSYAGDEVEYSITVRTLTNNTPSTTHLIVELYNEDNGIVWQHDNNCDITEPINLAPGTYQFYAYNDTHDSKDNNATITIHPYNITCSPSVLAWLIDKDTNLTFTVTPIGNGDLRIHNIDNNNAIATGTTTIQIIDGTGHLEGVNAIELGNITFDYRPYDGQYQSADGILKVTTANAIPDPYTIYTNEPTSVTITITHPSTGEPIPDVKVGLIGNILLSIPGDETTDINGQVTFGITTGGSGDIIITMEDKFDPDNTFVIESTTRQPMKLSAPSTVNENEKFIITLTSNNNPVTDTVTINFAGDTFTTSTGTIELRAPSVNLDLDYHIEATATGYTDDEATIRVSNIRQLIILLDNPTANGNDEISVIVTDDTGRTIIGATLTFNGKTYRTDVDGKTTIILPNEDNTYTLKASFNGFQSCNTPLQVTAISDDTPSFTFLTLLVSLGISLILIRRKNENL